jgi:hypothetical protein
MLSYWPARLHRLAESIPGFLKSLKIPSQAACAGGLDSFELSPGLSKRLQIRALGLVD